MPTEETITINLLKETGYSTWLDFAFNVSGSACSKGICKYTYNHAQGDKRDIQLEIGTKFLERLALEEAKINLPVINVASFAAFDELPHDPNIWIDDRIYFFDVVVRDKNDKVFLKRMQYKRPEIEKLQKWEAKYSGELVYVEKRELKNDDRNEIV